MQKESSQAWYNVFNYYTWKYGGIFLFNCNFDADRLSSQMPPFYASILENWSLLRWSLEDESYANQIMWNNLEIQIDNKMVFSKHMFEKEIITNQFNINVNDYLLLQGIVSCIKKCSDKEISQLHTDDIRAIIKHIMIPKAFSHLKVIKSKHFYEKFVEMKDEQSLSYFRLKHKYELSDTELYKA